MKHANITCPYCHSRAYLRPASVVYGQAPPDPAAKLYVCARFPFCDAYVAAHQKTRLPMGTLANKELRAKRKEAHQALDKLWQSGLMTRKEAYRLIQVYLGLSEEDAHIAKFSLLRCEQVIDYCNSFYKTAVRHTA